MICQIKIDSKGNVVDVLAPNGKKSLAYDSLLDIVTRTTNKEVLQAQFRDWVGRHINNINDDKELALGLYKQLYSPLFKDWFGDWEEVANALSNKDKVKGLYSVIFEQDPQRALFEAASQYNNSDSEKEGAIKIFGTEIIDSANKLFPNAKNGDDYIPIVGETDENGEPLLTNDRYVNANGDQRNILNQSITDPSQSLYQLTDSSPETIPSRASRETIALLKEFLNRMGVKLESVTNMVVNGRTLGANGMADAMNKLIQITEGNEDVALTEEAFHVAVEVISQKDPSLFKEMMNKIGRFNIYQQVYDDYKTTYVTPDNKPDIPKIKKEAIGKVLAETFIRTEQGTTEKPEFLNLSRNWWQSIIDALKKFFLRTGINLSNIFKEDPFDIAISVIKDQDSNYDPEKVSKEEGEFLQKAQKKPLSEQVEEIDKNIIADDEGQYEVNGKKAQTLESISARTKEGRKSRYREERTSDQRKADRAFLNATEGTIKIDIYDIFNRLVNPSGNIRETEIPKTNVSAIDPYDNTFYNSLEANMRDRLNSYDPRTKFYADTNIYNSVTNQAGTVDFMAIMPDGKVDILQFKAPELKFGATDIHNIKQAEYNKEIEYLRSILEGGYGVKKADFRNTRTIPIKANYEHVIPGDIRSPLSKITNLTIGNVNVKLIQDDVLIPIPSRSEITGNKNFDTFISKLRGLLQKTIDNYDPQISSIQRAETIQNLFNSIKKLQVQRSTESLLSQARTFNKRQEVVYTNVKKAADEVDPATATDSQISDIANKIMDDYDESEIYAHMDDALHQVFTEDTAEDKKILSEASQIAQNSRNQSSKFLTLATRLQIKYGAKVGITDEFQPEKQLTWYRRMVRSLSQSHTTAGKLLWKIVSTINTNFDIKFKERVKNLEEMHDKVSKWLGGRNINELYKKFFEFKDGRWTGKVIKKYAQKFDTDLSSAQEKGDTKFVKENIDMDKYKAWFKEKHKERIEQTKNNTYSEDADENQRRIYSTLSDFVNTFSPDSRTFVNKGNYMLKEFPLDKHFSTEYSELLKPENAPVLEVYNYWGSRLKTSIENGMIDDHKGWAWFPNVRRSITEKLTTAKAGGKLKDFLLGSTLRDTEDADFGKLDPINKKPINEVHAQYVSDLGQWVGEQDAKYWDFSAKSMDIFKVLGMWDKEILKYELKTDSEGLAKMLAFTEKNRLSLKTGRGGKIARDENDQPIEDDNNEINYQYLQDHLESVFYGKNVSNQSDFTLNIPIKSVAEKINKLAGRKVVDVPEQEHITISGTKGLSFLNRWFLTKTLGLNPLTPIANLFGGTVNSYINQGKFFNKVELTKAEINFTTHRLYSDDRHKKMAGMLAYIHPYVENKTMEHIRKLSLSNAVKYFSSDFLFVAQRGSDVWVNQVIAMAFLDNAMVKDGKIVNIREEARRILDFDKNKYAGDWKDTVAFNKALEEKVEELRKSPESLLNFAQIKDDKIEIPGLDLHGAKVPETVQNLRGQMLEFIKDALGNTSRDDLSLYKRQVLMQSFAMFKNWIPRMVDVRGQSLRYNAGSDQYEWGRMRMLVNALGHNLTGTIKGLVQSLGGNDSTLVEIGKKAYAEKLENGQREQEPLNMSEAEFLDMYTKGISAQFKELGLAVAMIGIVLAARLNAPDEDEDAVLKGKYKWLLRLGDKLQDEVSFFYNPQSFSDIVNGSIFPAAGLLLDASRFFGASTAKLFYHLDGDSQRESHQHPTKYLFRMFPVTKEMLNYIAIFDQDLAKKWDLRVSSRNGSNR